MTNPSKSALDEAQKIREQFERNLGSAAGSQMSEVLKLAQAQASAAKAFESLARPSRNMDWAKTPKISFEGANQYASAQVLIESLSAYYKKWSETVSDELQIAVYALMQDGSIISINSLAWEGFNGVIIQGKINGVDCIFLTHQSSLQFLCVAEPVTEPKRIVGFKTSD